MAGVTGKGPSGRESLPYQKKDGQQRRMGAATRAHPSFNITISYDFKDLFA